MIDFDSFQTDVAAWATGLVSIPTYWDQVMVKAGNAMILARVTGTSADAGDVTVAIFTADGDTNLPTLSGHRVVTVRFVFHDQMGYFAAWQYAERFRLRAFRPDSLATLQTAGLGLADVSTGAKFDTTKVAVDVTLHVAACEANDDALADAYIGDVDLDDAGTFDA